MYDFLLLLTASANRLRGGFTEQLDSPTHRWLWLEQNRGGATGLAGIDGGEWKVSVGGGA